MGGRDQLWDSEIHLQIQLQPLFCLQVRLKWGWVNLQNRILKRAHRLSLKPLQYYTSWMSPTIRMCLWSTPRQLWCNRTRVSDITKTYSGMSISLYTETLADLRPHSTSIPQLPRPWIYFIPRNGSLTLTLPEQNVLSYSSCAAKQPPHGRTLLVWPPGHIPGHPAHSQRAHGHGSWTNTKMLWHPAFPPSTPHTALCVTSVSQAVIPFAGG